MKGENLAQGWGPTGAAGPRSGERGTRGEETGVARGPGRGEGAEQRDGVRGDAGPRP